MNEYSTTSFEKGLEQLGISLEEHQIRQFLEYYEILVEWNKVMNLTGITEYEEVIAKHFLDSLALVKVCDLSGHKKVIDIGTGAGFPGIPLKIAFPELEIVLLDSLNKRIKFLNEVIEKLGLKNIRTIHGRAEDFARQKEYRENFDLCVSRAVANMSTLSEYCLPYVACGGKFIPYKSGKIDDGKILRGGRKRKKYTEKVPEKSGDAGERTAGVRKKIEKWSCRMKRIFEIFHERQLHFIFHKNLTLFLKVQHTFSIK